MSYQSSTSSFESLNESYTKKYGLEPYMHEPTISNNKNICYDTAERYVKMIIVMNSDEESYPRECWSNLLLICGNCSKMETSTEVFVVVKC